MLEKRTNLRIPVARRLVPAAVVLAFVTAACTQAGAATNTSLTPKAALTDNTSRPDPVPTAPSAATNVRIDDPNEYVFPQLLPLDGILPIYEPEFANAAESRLLDEELVMGVTLDGEAKAYPISVLRSREMINDELGGIPILVTW